MTTQTTATTHISLWPHQAAALDAIFKTIRGGTPAGLLVLPTGAGKTVTFLTAARDLGEPTLVLVHRDELVRQTVATIKRVWPAARVGVIQGERDEWRDGEDLVVASVQSLHARRLATMPKERFGLLVVDEAHHTPAVSYTSILEYFRVRFRLGVTATPKRLDGEGLADYYGTRPLFTYSIRQAITDRVLVPITSFKVVTAVNLDQVGTRGGDFAEGELADVVNTLGRNKAVVNAYVEKARGRRAIVFAVDVQHVEDLAAAFLDAGVAAVSVTGRDATEARRQKLADFAGGVYEVLVNCQIATEGFDDPGISCVIMARPTASESLYIQCVGRGLRRCDGAGKEDCLILDITDGCKRHKLRTAADLLGEEKERIQQEDHDQAEKPAAKPTKKKVENKPVVFWRLAEVSPWPEMPDLTGYVPTRPWHHDLASAGQLKYLRSFGLEASKRLTKGEAAFLLTKAIALDQAHPTPATAKQQRYLQHLGHWKQGLSKREANGLIFQLKGRAS